ncbi:AAA domain-containing protein [Heliobacterium gestii]|uniref:AAA domain-containing protein n=1 Tax=Heliomicrobium gestii TaxID=2699 RepID=A0A845LB55_HELGE|nr:AAA family ATPase [Heliomicrobium gestii]MBM7865649.1 ATP-dependent Clp protease ATP-binding subunit ClpA [Heliomicrobium gestii]MZP41899.1 AAA domain-containing protein [Heliomicrobium gestii]
MAENRLAKWHRELDRFRAFKTTFIIEGNIYDIHAYPTPTGEGLRWDLLKLDRYLYNYLMANGYGAVVYYDHIDGFSNEFSPAMVDDFLCLAGEKRLHMPGNVSPRPPSSTSSLSTPSSAMSPVSTSPPPAESAPPSDSKPKKYAATLDRATELIRLAMDNREQPLAIILNLASRYIDSPEHLSEEERQVYSRLLLTALKPRQVKARNADRPVNNLLFLIVSKTNDVPVWFYHDNPFVKTICIGKPDKSSRRRFIDGQWKFFAEAETLSDHELEKFKERFIDLTEGMKNLELNGLKLLCRQEGIPVSRIQDAISLYKYGLKENPWDELSREKLCDAEGFICRRVKGQDYAVQQTLDIIKRAVGGLSGLQHSSGSSKPKGILFFAGPTGTGKTELAKTLAQLLFGDESACIRFDMSEYQQSHADQKLLGAPPGYVGYEAGGQLTNAVRERPFSILLFDEIEKAHGSILDKFLQILEDGRMTDGRGETVYFSESIIIFTSNLGNYRKDEMGNRQLNISPEMTYGEIRQRSLASIKEYFVLELGRPEIMNRIGNNFVVFDYIRSDVAEQIMDSQLKKIAGNLREHRGIDVVIEGEARAGLLALALGNLENGGRGIGNVVEKYLINPLSRCLFDRQVGRGATVRIRRLFEENDIVHLDSAVESAAETR